MNIGAQVKKLRTSKKMSLRQLSLKTNLSIGFLSQFERGLTTIAVDSLSDIAKVMNVDLSYFFHLPDSRTDDVICSYEQTITLVESDKFLHTYLSKNLKNKSMFPEIVTLIPEDAPTAHTPFCHDGEEFLYVLEGVLTLVLASKTQRLHPGDSIHFPSSIAHNWYNSTNRMTKILVVHLPNPFSLEGGQQ